MATTFSLNLVLRINIHKATTPLHAQLETRDNHFESPFHAILRNVVAHFLLYAFPVGERNQTHSNRRISGAPSSRL